MNGFTFTEATTEQDVFDYAVDFLMKQGEPAFSNEACRYRGRSGDTGTLCCGVGCFIPDDKYSPSMEGRGINSLLRFMSETMPYDPFWRAMDKHSSLLASIQRIHDESARSDFRHSKNDVRKNWLEKFGALAFGRGLAFDASKYSHLIKE